MRNKLGAQLYTVRQYTQTLPEISRTFARIAAIGYRAIQISGFGPVDPGEVGKMAADNGLAVVATHMGWDRFLNNLDDVIAIHKIWGCVHAAIGGLFNPEYEGFDGIKRFLEELQPVAAKLAREDIDFSYHNHNHELMRCGLSTWLAELYDRADPGILQAELDVYWLQAGGADPTAWIRRCAGREPLLHLKDMAVGPDRSQRMAEIGEGNLNWPAILQAAGESGVEWYLVEQDECYGRDPFESLAISYRNLVGMGL